MTRHAESTVVAEMRRGLAALVLEVPPDVSAWLTTRFETLVAEHAREIVAARSDGYNDGRRSAAGVAEHAVSAVTLEGHGLRAMVPDAPRIAPGGIDTGRLAAIEDRANHVASGAPFKVMGPNGKYGRYSVVANDGDVLAEVGNLIGADIAAESAAEFYAKAPTDVLDLVVALRGQTARPRDGDRYVATITIGAGPALIEALRLACLDVLGASFPYEQAGSDGDARTRIQVECVGASKP